MVQDTLQAPGPGAAHGQAPDTRRRILEAARQCFSRYGFHKTSMEDIAREAGLSRGSVYRHFPDKETLFRTVSETQAGEFLADVRRRTGELEGEGLMAQIAEVVRMVHAYIHENPLNAAMARTDPDAFARVLTTEGQTLLAMSISAVSPLVEVAVARGELRPDLDGRRAAEWIARIMFSLVTTPAVTFDRDDPEQVAAFLGDYLVPGLD